MPSLIRLTASLGSGALPPLSSCSPPPGRYDGRILQHHTGQLLAAHNLRAPLAWGFRVPTRWRDGSRWCLPSRRRSADMAEQAGLAREGTGGDHQHPPTPRPMTWLPPARGLSLDTRRWWGVSVWWHVDAGASWVPAWPYPLAPGYFQDHESFVPTTA